MKDKCRFARVGLSNFQDYSPFTSGMDVWFLELNRLSLACNESLMPAICDDRLLLRIDPLREELMGSLFLHLPDHDIYWPAL